jgi:hypothetical protein
MIDCRTRRILSIVHAAGSCHDMRLFTQSLSRRQIWIDPDTSCFTDSAYTGIGQYHRWSFVPVKGSKHYPLHERQKRGNRYCAVKRVVIEHVIGAIKRFRSLSEKCRCRLDRFQQRFRLIAGVYNMLIPT